MSAEDRFEVVVTAAVFHGDKVLLTRRAATKKRLSGAWVVPGGHLSLADFAGLPKETDYWYGAAETALRRELREETGLEVGPLRHVLDLENVHDDGAVFILLYAAEWARGRVVLDPAEADGHAWVQEGQLGLYVDDGLLMELRKAFRVIRGAR